MKTLFKIGFFFLILNLVVEFVIDGDDSTSSAIIEKSYYTSKEVGIATSWTGGETPWSYKQIDLLEDGFVKISQIQSSGRRDDAKGKWQKIDGNFIEISGLLGELDIDGNYRFKRFNGKYKWDGMCLKREKPYDEFCSDYK